MHENFEQPLNRQDAWEREAKYDALFSRHLASLDHRNLVASLDLRRKQNKTKNKKINNHWLLPYQNVPTLYGGEKEVDADINASHITCEKLWTNRFISAMRLQVWVLRLLGKNFFCFLNF